MKRKDRAKKGKKGFVESKTFKFIGKHGDGVGGKKIIWGKKEGQASTIGWRKRYQEGDLGRRAN